MIDGPLLFNENALMKSPFRKGRRVCIANDMVLVRGVVTEFTDLGSGSWGVWINVPAQPGLSDLVRDFNFLREVDVTYSGGVFKGYTGPSPYEIDGSIELFVVPQNSGAEIRQNRALTDR